MPTQAELAAVADAQAVEQRRLAEAAALAVLAYWLAVDETDLVSTAETFLSRSLGVLTAAYRRSAGVALAFAQVRRRLELPDEPVLQVPLVTPDAEVIRKSLTYVGVATTAIEQTRPRDERDAAPTPAETEALELLRRAAAGLGDRARPITPVKERAAVRLAGSALRHTTAGGREQVDAFVAADRKATGYVRITQADCCYFCAMLASRGPVYKDDSFARSDPRFEGPGNHKVHDHCRCSMQPVYSKSMLEWPEASFRYDELWRRATDAYDNVDNLFIRRFRALYEGREMPEQ